MTTQENVTTNRPKKEDTKNRTKIGQQSRTKEIGHEQVGQKIRTKNQTKKIGQKNPKKKIEHEIGLRIRQINPTKKRTN